MVLELNHVGIQVKDITRCIDFYTKILEGKIVSDAMIPSTQTRCVYIQLQNSMVELLYRGDGVTPPKFGFVHVAFLVDDLDKRYESLVTKGYTFSVLPKIAGSGRGRLAFLTDPNGVKIELIQRDDSFRVNRFSGQRILAFDHISISAPNLESAEKFYIQDMGMKLAKKMRIDSRDLDMVYLIHGDDTIELLHRTQAQNTVEAIGHLAFRVDSVDSVSAYLTNLGIELEPGSPKPAGTGIGRVCLFKDPEGNKMELVDRKDIREL
jgi:catechol 2,3-dioxygenase-like lactoylglutathione lyase family enzyme